MLAFLEINYFEFAPAHGLIFPPQLLQRHMSSLTYIEICRLFDTTHV